MRLPQPLVESPFFAFASVDDFLAAFDTSLEEEAEVRRLGAIGLPPVTSMEGLATLLGVNAGIVWSFVNRPSRHYRTFPIPKGHTERIITAPKVGLKVIQKWLSYHLAHTYKAHDHVFGFVPGRSHIAAAMVHANAEWALSVDIRDFFPTTPQAMVEESYRSVGYQTESAKLLAALSCLNGSLVQGAPTSPPLSNVCFRAADASLNEIATQFGLQLSRYADDIVFSGLGEPPAGLREALEAVIAGTPWELHPEKINLQPIKGRIKIHGFVVRDGRVRLTKGYRNKIRTFAHILRTRSRPENEMRLRGHVQYARHVSTVVGEVMPPMLAVLPPRPRQPQQHSLLARLARLLGLR
jgi:RNA-directed DNA polymerase